jgi:iron complex outermembrane recepter protein
MNRFNSRRFYPAATICVTWTLASTSFAAQPAPANLDAVVVSADRINADVEDERSATPGAVTTLDGDAFHERSVTQLSAMLRYVPGVWAESYNGNDDVFYSSRGSNLDATDYDKNGVKFLQDGLPVTAADGNNHNRALDPLNARHVIVAHGANALAYGASTLGGAIDFISRTARMTAPSSASLAVGSFDQRSARTTLGGASDRLDGLLSVEAEQRDGYRAHSRMNRKSVYANAGWQSSETVSTRLYAMLSDYFAELPRELTPAQVAADPRQARADAITDNHSKSVETWRVAFKTTVAQVAGGTLELGASHEQQSLYHPIVSGPFFSLLIDTDHRDNGAMLRWHRGADSHDMLLGANYGFSTVSGGNYENNGGERGMLMWMTNDDASGLELFALDRWQFAPQWTFVYGTQLVSARRDVGGFKAAYDSFNPRLGLIHAYGEGSEWFSSVSRIYEAPTTFELADDANGGSNALEAMHGIVLETGLRGTAMRGETRFTWELSGYYTSLRDEILSVDDPNAPGTSLSANIEKTTHAGVEALLGASFAIGGGHRVEPLLNMTFNAFSFDSDPAYRNNRLPAAPRHFVRGEVLYRDASGFFAGPTFDFIGNRYVDFANSYSVDAYALFGVRAGFTSDHWEIFAEVRNLLDKQYIAAVVVKDQASPATPLLHPGAPRSAYVGARYRF